MHKIMYFDVSPFVIVSFIYLGSHTMCGGIEIPIRDALFC